MVPEEKRRGTPESEVEEKTAEFFLEKGLRG